MITNLPAQPDLDQALIREIAMDIGKAAVEHLEVMYPAALEAVPKAARLSLRNCIHNEIMAALATVDANEIRARLDDRKASRRRRLAFHRKTREPRKRSKVAADLAKMLSDIPKHDRGYSWELRDSRGCEALRCYNGVAKAFKFILDNTDEVIVALSALEVDR